MNKKTRKPKPTPRKHAKPVVLAMPFDEAMKRLSHVPNPPKPKK